MWAKLKRWFATLTKKIAMSFLNVIIDRILNESLDIASASSIIADETHKALEPQVSVKIAVVLTEAGAKLDMLAQAELASSATT